MSAMLNVLLLLSVLGSGLAPDVITEGHRRCRRQIFVDPGDQGRDWSFFATSFERELVAIDPNVALRGRYFIKVLAVPRAHLNLVDEALAHSDVGLDEVVARLGAAVSKKLVPVVEVPDADPVHGERIRYRVMAVRDGLVELEEVERQLLREDGSVISPAKVESIRGRRQLSLVVIALVGVGGLGFLLYRRARRGRLADA